LARRRDIAIDSGTYIKIGKVEERLAISQSVEDVVICDIGRGFCDM